MTSTPVIATTLHTALFKVIGSFEASRSSSQSASASRRPIYNLRGRGFQESNAGPSFGVVGNSWTSLD